MLMRHLSPPPDCEDEKKDMVEDLHHRHGGKPKTESQYTPCCPEEPVSRHLPVPDHLLVVRVLQEHLTQKFSSDAEQFSHPNNKKVVLSISCNSIFKFLFESFDSFVLIGVWGVKSIFHLAVFLLVQPGIWELDVKKFD